MSGSFSEERQAQHRRLRRSRYDDVQSVESVGEGGETVYWWERYGGALTAFDWTRERTVSVGPSRTHRERATECFLDPSRHAPGSYLKEGVGQ